MKVGKQPVDRAKAMPGMNEEAGRAVRRTQWRSIPCARLEHSHHRGADRDDAAAIAPSLLDRPSGCRGKRVALLVHGVVLDAGAADRREGGEADVEAQGCPPDARAAQTVHDGGREMQSRRRGGGGVRIPGRVRRLVALGVAQVGADVGGQRCDAGVFDRGIRIGSVEGHRASSAVLRRDRDDGGAEVTPDADDRAWRGKACRAREALIVAACLARQHEQLDVASRAVDAIKPRPPDPRVVDDQEIARTEQLGQVAKLEVLEAALREDVEQPGCVAFRKGLLGDPLHRERVVEVGGPQRSKSAVCASAAPGAPAGTGSPRCWYAAAVASRPRSVRASSPRRMRKGSTMSSMVSGSSCTLTAMVWTPTAWPPSVPQSTPSTRRSSSSSPMESMPSTSRAAAATPTSMRPAARTCA